MIETSCTGCGKRYRIDEDKMPTNVGRFTCKTCGVKNRVVKPEARENLLGARPDMGASPGATATTKDDMGITLKTEAVAEVGKPPGRPSKDLASLEQAATDPSEPSKSKAESKAQKTSAPTTKGIGLRTKIILVMLLIALVPFVVFWGITFRDTGRRMEADNRLLMIQIAEGLGKQVDEWVDKNIRVLQTASNISALNDMDSTSQKEVLKAIQTAYPYMYLVFTLDKNGANIARSDGKKLRDYADRKYYQDVVGGKPVSWQALVGKTSGKPALVISVPIRKDGQLVGVLAAAMTTDEISKHVATWTKGKTGFAFLVDENSKVVAHQEKEFVIKEENLNDHPLVQAYRKDGQTQTLSFQKVGRNYEGAVRGNQMEWALVVQQASDEVFSTLARVQRFALILLGITLIVVLLVALLSARALVKPIAKLTDVANRMSMGELDVKVDIQSKDEIGMLAEAIGRMQTSLKLAMNRLRRRRG